MSSNAIVKRGPLRDHLDAFKAHQADPECVVVLARGDGPPTDPATYRVFPREEPASPGRFLTLGFDEFYALSLRSAEAPLIFPMGLFAVAAHVEVRIADPIAYLIAAATQGDDVFAALRARIARALEGQDGRAPEALFTDLQALGDALEHRVAPFEGLRILRCRFERMEAAPEPFAPSPSLVDRAREAEIGRMQAQVEAPSAKAQPREPTDVVPLPRSASDVGGLEEFGSSPVAARKYSARTAARAPAPAPAPAQRAPAAFAADASAFAPRRFRHSTPELVQVLVHRPKDKAQARKLALAADPDGAGAGAGAKLGALDVGTQIAVALDAGGAAVRALSPPQSWTGEPLVFAFTVEAAPDARGQIVCAARILADDAQIGAIAFARPLAKENAKPDKPAAVDAKMRRARRVFLSYSSGDRATVALVADAYARAGVPCFFDRTALTGGEDWSPRLFKEIERADLFHLFWSQNAAKSDWVARETRHALSRRRGSFAKRPDITIQMLDGPPWAPHPPDLDALNFDDFTRAAIVGYARGAG